jgi:hypothetical protein
MRKTDDAVHLGVYPLGCGVSTHLSGFYAPSRKHTGGFDWVGRLILQLGVVTKIDRLCLKDELPIEVCSRAVKVAHRGLGPALRSGSSPTLPLEASSKSLPLRPGPLFGVSQGPFSGVGLHRTQLAPPACTENARARELKSWHRAPVMTTWSAWGVNPLWKKRLYVLIPSTMRF